MSEQVKDAIVIALVVVAVVAFVVVAFDVALRMLTP
jgi:hypothetical protein